jgi:hypothetical protein
MKSTRLAAPFLVGAVLFAARAHAQFIDPANNAVQLQILAENVKQSISLSSQLTQLQQSVTAARENLDLARSVYAGVSEFTSYSPEDFLREGRDYFLAANPELSNALAFGQELTRPVGEGGLLPRRALHVGVDAYGDERRRREAAPAGLGTPYDSRAAWGLSREVNAVLDDVAMKASLVRPPTVSTAAEGLLAFDMARTEPGLLELYMRRQASALSAQEAAMAVFKESTAGRPSPGKAQQLTAQSSAMTAVGVSRLAEMEAKQLSLQELQRQEEAQARAQEKREMEALWKQIGTGIQQSFKRSAPKDMELPSEGQR